MYIVQTHALHIDIFYISSSTHRTLGYLHIIAFARYYRKVIAASDFSGLYTFFVIIFHSVNALTNETLDKILWISFEIPYFILKSQKSIVEYCLFMHLIIF